MRPARLGLHGRATDSAARATIPPFCRLRGNAGTNPLACGVAALSAARCHSASAHRRVGCVPLAPLLSRPAAVVVAAHMRGAFMHELVRVGSLGIVGEIIKIDKDQAYVQVSRMPPCLGVPEFRARRALLRGTGLRALPRAARRARHQGSSSALSATQTPRLAPPGLPTRSATKTQAACALATRWSAPRSPSL